MEGYLKQIYDEDSDTEELYWFPVDVESETIKTAYNTWQYNWNIDDPEEDDPNFEVWWNEGHPDIQIQRVFVTEIFVP